MQKTWKNKLEEWIVTSNKDPLFWGGERSNNFSLQCLDEDTLWSMDSRTTAIPEKKKFFFLLLYYISLSFLIYSRLCIKSSHFPLSPEAPPTVGPPVFCSCPTALFTLRVFDPFSSILGLGAYN